MYPTADYHNGTTLLTLDDLHSGLLGPYDMGAQGVVIWGSTTELKNETFVKVSFIHNTIHTSSSRLSCETKVNYTNDSLHGWL